jgi:hypothetical protein
VASSLAQALCLEVHESWAGLSKTCGILSVIVMFHSYQSDLDGRVVLPGPSRAQT